MIINDDSCSWINHLEERKNIQTLKKNCNCDWLVVGAGYTGLSAARKLGKLHPNENIVLVDSQLAGEGASARNSGYLVDTTLNDGFNSNKDLIISQIFLFVLRLLYPAHHTYKFLIFPSHLYL